MSSNLTTSPKPFEHIGWDLTQAARAWKSGFVAAMVERGHNWFGEARGNLVHLIGPEGTKQQALVSKSGLSKQAVQQLLDELERDGIIKREIDGQDARGRRILFTAKGQQALRHAQEIKVMIEADYMKLIGKDGLQQLKSALDKIVSASQVTA